MLKLSSKVFLLVLILSISACGLIIIFPGGVQVDPEDYRVENGVRPSELIYQYTGIVDSSQKQNFVCIYYSPYCQYSYKQFYGCNKLYDSTKNNFVWFAISPQTMDDENNAREKLSLTDSIHFYSFPVKSNVVGLGSSLQNLYYNNSLPKDEKYGLGTPSTFVISNDTIRRLIKGAIYSESKYKKTKALLDSLARGS